MTVEAAQSEMRAVYLSGSVGQVVSGVIWLISAAVSSWLSWQAGALVLVFGGALIFPLTQATLRAMGHRASLSSFNPLRYLAMQIAFIVPLCIPVVAAAALHKPVWFYPGMMIVVGAHYLPFVFLYGLRRFAVLAASLLAGGMVFGLGFADEFSVGGWFTGVVLLLFGIHLCFHRN
jgi:hypothetical protein